MLADKYAWTLIGQSCLRAMWERLCRLLHTRQEILPLDLCSSSSVSFFSFSLCLYFVTATNPIILLSVLNVTKVKEARNLG